MMLNDRKYFSNKYKHLLIGLAAVVVFLSIWVPQHPATPHMATSDLYAHLCIARHLCQGDGFQNDIIYPLSFAFPFAQSIPQPLIHRQPGYSILLTLPYLAAGKDPQRTLDYTRVMQIVFLGLIAWIGVHGHLKRKRLLTVLPWLLLIGFNPMLTFAVDWSFVELVCALLLFVLWLRVRDGLASSPGPLDGLLAGVVAVIRLDVVWIPFLWWAWYVWARNKNLPSTNAEKPFRLQRGWKLALLIWIVVMTPWAVRNTLVTGEPLFYLQRFAEHAKMTKAWPEYSVYQQLEPQYLIETLKGDPQPVIRKIAKGLIFYIKHLRNFVPQFYLWFAGLASIVFLLGSIAKVPCPFRRDQDRTMSIIPAISPLGPLVVSSITLGLLLSLYTFFDHSLRHLVVLLPVLLWEAAPLSGDLPWTILSRRIPGDGVKKTAVGVVGCALFTCLILLALPTKLPGWQYAAKSAKEDYPNLVGKIQALRDAPEGVAYIDGAAEIWFANRPAVWRPRDAQVKSQIEKILREKELAAGLPDSTSR